MEYEVISLITFIKDSMEDNPKEKQKLVGELIRIPFLLNKRFSGNRNLEKAIEYFKENITYIINESELEYNFCEKALNYLVFLQFHPESMDEEIIAEIDETYDMLTDRFMLRTIEAASLVHHYEGIISSGILTDKNFYFNAIVSVIDEDTKEEILDTVPSLKKGS